MAHADSEILFSTKKKWTIKPWKNMEELEVHVIKCKKPVWKGCVCLIQLHDSLKKAQLWRRNPEDDSGLWKHYEWHLMRLSKPAEYTAPGMNSTVNCRLWETVSGHCSFINCNKFNKCATLLEDVERRRQEQGCVQNFCSFSIVPKLLW